MVVTIFAIAGTLFSCGRYGSPVRVLPVEDATPQPEDEDGVVGVTLSDEKYDDESDQEPPDRSSEPR
jgi:hypothetical protein